MRFLPLPDASRACFSARRRSRRVMGAWERRKESGGSHGIVSAVTCPSWRRTMRVEYCWASSGLCVTMITRRSWLSSLRISMIWTEVAESRAPVGSSARMISGLLTMARAMATRCIWPPESCVGFLMHLVAQTDANEGLFGATQAFFARDAADGQRELDVAQDGLVHDEVVALEHEADRMVAVRVPVLVVEALGGTPVDDKVARRITVKAAQDVEQGRLAANPTGRESKRTRNRGSVTLMPLRARTMSSPTG